MQLKDWLFVKEPDGSASLFGRIFGDYRFEDDHPIYTSAVQRLYDLGDLYVAETRSGTLYELPKDSMKDVRHWNREVLDQIPRSEELIEQRLLEFNALVAEKRSYKDKALDEAHDWAEQHLENGQMYLVMDLDHVATLYAAHKYDGQILEIEPRVHVGTFQDSVLVSDVLHGIDFRYFPEVDGITPYCWDEGLDAIYIHNISDDPILVQMKNNIKCNGHEITRLFRDAFTQQADSHKIPY